MLQSVLTCKKAGTILRRGSDRVVSLQLDSTGRVLSCHVSWGFTCLKCLNTQKGGVVSLQLEKAMRGMSEEGEGVVKEGTCTILRRGSDRVVSLQLDSTGRVLGCHVSWVYSLSLNKWEGGGGKRRYEGWGVACTILKKGIISSNGLYWLGCLVS